MRTHRRKYSLGRRQGGFSLIEVMVAVVVLAVGLLAFALLQAMSVRYAQSSNRRTQATNLSYEMFDQMRVNRLAAANYAGEYQASSTDCEPGGTVGAASFKAAWQCRLGAALGDDARAVVSYAGGTASVTVTWGDERWNDANGDGAVAAEESDRSFTVRTRL